LSGEIASRLEASLIERDLKPRPQRDPPRQHQHPGNPAKENAGRRSSVAPA
jgi:hypothetical protein